MKWWTKWRCVTEGCGDSGSGDDQKKIDADSERHVKKNKTHATMTSTRPVGPDWGPDGA